MPSPDRPRVAYVLKMYPRLSETFIVNEMLAHEADGLDLDIFSLRAPIDGRFHAMLGRVRASVTYLRRDRLRASELWSAMRAASRRRPNLWEVLGDPLDADEGDVHQALELADEIERRGITHLHAHFATAATTVARLASRLTGVPYTFTAHAKDIYHDTVDQAALGAKLRDAATAVTVTDYNADWLREQHGADAGGVRRVYNGLDLEEFEYVPPADRERIVLGVGRLVEKKGFDDLVDACAILVRRGVDFHCDLVGGGPLHGALAAQVERLGVGDRVTLHGPQPRDEVVRQLRRAAVMAAPCVIGEDGNRDGLPTTLLESMALGTPCITTDVTGIPEAIEDERTGLVVPRRDPEALADRLERMLDDPSLQRRLADAARGLVEDRFDIRRNAAELRAVFAASRTAAVLGVA